MSRTRWFLVGAAAAGALAAVPAALRRMRMAEPPPFESAEAEPEPAEAPPAAHRPPAEPPPVSVFATFDPTETNEMRAKIDETRARIAEKAAARAAGEEPAAAGEPAPGGD